MKSSQKSPFHNQEEGRVLIAVFYKHAALPPQTPWLHMVPMPTAYKGDVELGTWAGASPCWESCPGGVWRAGLRGAPCPVLSCWGCGQEPAPAGRVEGWGEMSSLPCPAPWAVLVAAWAAAGTHQGLVLLPEGSVLLPDVLLLPQQSSAASTRPCATTRTSS